MSRLDYVESLEKQLSDLEMSRDLCSPSKGKKIPPAVPPKKKAQPQVPHSAVVSTLREPSYSTKLPSASNNNFTTYALSNVRQSPNYANVSHFETSIPHNYRQNIASQTHKSNYSNVTNFQSENNNMVPPPLPLPVIYKPPIKSLEKGNNEHFLPPPSPVSSNYSELARATANLSFNQDRPYPIYQNEYPEYGISQGSTYESIYEPINLRPPSNITTEHSNHGFISDNIITTNKSPLPKEEEVDTLTNLLVQSITDSQDLDVFGVCIKCKEKVIGESSGCTAMGHVYHVKCFCCHICNINLQGKPFYAVEGQPYCESDYYETLEKCSVCDEPILDRILRATGKPYHPSCFTCVVCGKSLDGIPFTVDAMNQIHCIDDFHKKFAPRCCVCELPIMPEEGEEETVRVVALDRSFHVRCYRCEDCGMLLSSEAEGRGCYPLDDHILCKNCNAHRIRLLTNVMTTDL